MKSKYRGTREEDNIDELGDAFFKKARRVGRPVSEHPKQPVKIRLDEDVIEALRASGKGWQTRLNAFLSDAIKEGRL
ncbi:MAG: BrnA antitoxin family protein [Rickettsiales bacterium]